MLIRCDWEMKVMLDNLKFINKEGIKIIEKAQNELKEEKRVREDSIDKLNNNIKKLLDAIIDIDSLLINEVIDMNGYTLNRSNKINSGIEKERHFFKTLVARFEVLGAVPETLKDEYCFELFNIADRMNISLRDKNNNFKTIEQILEEVQNKHSYINFPEG